MDSLVVEPSSHAAADRNLEGSRLLAGISLGFFLCAFALFEIGHWVGAPAFMEDQWTSGALLALAAVTTLISQARHLPVQSVMLAAVLIAVSGSAVEVVLISAGNVLGSHASNQGMEPWFWLRKVGQVSLVWIVAILNCRGVVRLVLRRWRFAPGYGFWVLGGTAILAALFLLSSSRWGPVQHGWPTIGSAVACPIGIVVCLLLVTPSLINKRPVPEKTEWHPVVIWVAFNLWFLLAAVGQGK